MWSIMYWKVVDTNKQFEIEKNKSYKYISYAKQ